MIVHAQSNMIGVTFLQNYSTFRFIDSEGSQDELDYTIKFGYGLSYQHLFGEHFYLEVPVQYNNKGANSTLDQYKLDWSFHYVNAGLNLGYRFTIGRLYPQFGLGAYYGRLLKADQYVGPDHYDLLVTNVINKNDYGVCGFVGLEYEYSDNGSVFLRINEAMGLLQLEEDSDQEMFNRTFSIQLGLYFTIK
jgi:hypothetical protein